MSRRRRGETIAHWHHDRRDGTTADYRATLTDRGQRLVIAERRGHRWATTRELTATDEAVRMLRRQRGRR